SRITQNSGCRWSRVVVRRPVLVRQYFALGPVGIASHQRNHRGILSLVGRRIGCRYRADALVAAAERNCPARSRRGGHDEGSERDALVRSLDLESAGVITVIVVVVNIPTHVIAADISPRQ